MRLSVFVLVLFNSIWEMASQQPFRRDIYGDPIPCGADVRLGTARLRHGGGLRQQVAFTPDGKKLVSASGYRRIRVWSAESGELIRQMDTGDESVRAFQLSPDGAIGAALGRRVDDVVEKQTYRTLQLWDVSTGNFTKTISWVGEGSASLAFAPTGAVIVTGSYDGVVRFWDIDSADELLTFKLPEPERDVQSLDVSPDSRHIALTTAKSAFLWRWQHPGQLVKLDIAALRRPTSVDFSPDGKLLAVGGMRDGVLLVDVVNGKRISQFKTGEQRGSTRRVLFSGDGQFLAAARGSVFVWDTTTGRLLQEFSVGPDNVMSLTFSPHSHQIAGGTLRGVIHAWNLKTGKNLANDSIGHRAEVNKAVFVPLAGQELVVTGSDDGTVRVWDAMGGGQRQIMRHTHWVRGMAVSPNGQYVASSGLDDTVRIWEMRTGKEIHRLPGHGTKGGIRELAFTQDDRQLVSWGAYDSCLRTWEVDTGRLVGEHELRPAGVKAPALIEEHDFLLEDVQYAPNATTILIPLERTIYVFDCQTGKELQPLTNDNYTTSTMMVSRDGKLILTAGLGEKRKVRLKDGKVRPVFSSAVLLRELATGKHLWKYSLPPGGRVSKVAFSPDDRFMAASLYDPFEMIRVWDVASGIEVATIKNLDRLDYHGALSFSADGKRIGCSMWDNSFLIWDLDRYRVKRDGTGANR